MLLGFSLRIWLVAFPEMRKMWGRQCEGKQEVDMHCEVEMVARHLVIGIWSSGKRSCLNREILESRM